MEWDRGLTRSQLVQRGARAALAGSLLGGVDLLARAGEAFAAARDGHAPFRLAAGPAPAEADGASPRQDRARRASSSRPRRARASAAC